MPSRTVGEAAELSQGGLQWGEVSGEGWGGGGGRSVGWSEEPAGGTEKGKINLSSSEFRPRIKTTQQGCTQSLCKTQQAVPLGWGERDLGGGGVFGLQINSKILDVREAGVCSASWPAPRFAVASRTAERLITDGICKVD